MKKLLIFKLREGITKNEYSYMSEEAAKTIPQDIIEKTIDLEDRLYSKDELETLRDQNI